MREEQEGRGGFVREHGIVAAAARSRRGGE